MAADQVAPEADASGAKVAVGAREKGTDLLTIGTVEKILEKAPSDLAEEVLEMPEWDCAVKVRSLTASQNAQVRQVSLDIGGQGKGPEVAWAEMEIAQFAAGVIEPKFTIDDVRKLHLTSGRGFARVISWLDEKSGNDKEELRRARQEFQGSSNGAESRVRNRPELGTNSG